MWLAGFGRFFAFLSVGVTAFFLSAIPVYAGIGFKIGSATKDVIVIEKPGLDDAVFASIGGLSQLTLIPNFEVPIGIEVFNELEISPLIASFSEDSSTLDLFTVSPIMKVTGQILATFELDSTLFPGALKDGFTFIEIGPSGSFEGQASVYLVPEPSSVALTRYDWALGSCSTDLAAPPIKGGARARELSVR